MTLVSVIVPAYNVAEYIGETLDSIFAQSFRDFEAIVVNDGSPDTVALESVLASHSDPRLRYLQKPNGGPSSARNTGIAAARGEWLAFLDADDLWLPNCLASQLALLEREGTAAAAVPDGFVFGDSPLAGKRLSEIKECQPGLVTLTEMLAGRSSPPYCCVAKRAAIERIGGFDESFKRSEDYDLYLRLLLAGERIVVNPEPLYRYRRRADSLSAEGIKLARSAARVLEKLEARFASDAELARLARDRRSDLLATVEFTLGRQALEEGRWLEARDYWRAHQQLRPSGRIAFALAAIRISPRLLLALIKARSRIAGAR
ncbi:MAG TPA: glycosyltransferase family A protein [Bryobacteraceae bacterium]